MKRVKGGFMKQVILSLFCLIVFCSSAFATTTAKVGFKAYSSNSSVTCTVFGMKKFTSISMPAQVFTPDADLSRNLVLGTKGFKNYSTPTKLGRIAIRFTCTNGVTPDLVPVKLFLNDVQTYFLILDQGVFGINP